MKTSDIIPGVVYAWATREDGYRQPVIVVDITHPVRILDSSYAGREARRLVSNDHAEPGARTYAAVMLSEFIVSLDRAAPIVENAQAIATKTLEDVLGQSVEQEKGLPEGTSIGVIRPRDIRSTWDEFVTAKQRETEVNNERAAREGATRAVNERNGQLLRAAFAERGIATDGWDSPVRINTLKGSAGVDFAILADLLGVTLEARR